jgi:hypothetical protein
MMLVPVSSLYIIQHGSVGLFKTFQSLRFAFYELLLLLVGWCHCVSFCSFEERKYKFCFIKSVGYNLKAVLVIFDM